MNKRLQKLFFYFFYFVIINDFFYLKYGQKCDQPGYRSANKAIKGALLHRWMIRLYFLFLPLTYYYIYIVLTGRSGRLLPALRPSVTNSCCKTLKPYNN